MFGLFFESTCPNCGMKHFVSLGACTGYYNVNHDEREWTDRVCPICNKPYWLYHGLDGFIDAKTTSEDDECELVRVTCW